MYIYDITFALQIDDRTLLLGNALFWNQSGHQNTCTIIASII